MNNSPGERQGRLEEVVETKFDLKRLDNNETRFSIQFSDGDGDRERVRESERFKDSFRATKNFFLNRVN